MEINSQVIDVLREFNINQNDAICYLISLHYGYKPSYIPEILMQKINTTGIYTLDEKGTVQWNVSLFDGGVTNFEWVKTEYVPLFKERNPQKGGKVREATARMKALFAKNPDIRKDDVLNATRYYLSCTNPSYIRFPHFFIQKGKGLDAIYDILDWIERYKENSQLGSGRSTRRNTMQ